MICLEASTHQRASSRLPASSNVWLQCRRPSADAPNLANGLLDFSDGGVQFLAKELLAAGDAVEIVLSGANMRHSIRRTGEARWVVPLGAEACCAGVQFHDPLSENEIQALTAPCHDLPNEDEATADNAMPPYPWH
jgi:hypothetical protein